MSKLYEGEGESRKMNISAWHVACFLCTLYDIVNAAEPGVEIMKSGATQIGQKVAEDFTLGRWMSGGLSLSKIGIWVASKAFSIVSCLMCLAGAATDIYNFAKELWDEYFA